MLEFTLSIFAAIFLATKTKHLWLKLFIAILLAPQLPLFGFAFTDDYQIWPIFTEYLSDKSSVSRTLQLMAACNISFFLTFFLGIKATLKSPKFHISSPLYGTVTTAYFLFFAISLSIFIETIRLYSTGGYYLTALDAAEGTGPSTASYFLYSASSLFVMIKTNKSPRPDIFFMKIFIVLLFFAYSIFTGNREFVPFIALALLPHSIWSINSKPNFSFVKRLKRLTLSRRNIVFFPGALALLLFIVYIGISRVGGSLDWSTGLHLLSILSISIIPNIAAVDANFPTYYDFSDSHFYFYRLLSDSFFGSAAGNTLLGGPVDFNTGLIYYPLQFGGSHYTLTSLIPDNFVFAILSQSLLALVCSALIASLFNLFKDQYVLVSFLVVASSVFLSSYSFVFFVRIIIAIALALFLVTKVLPSFSS